MKWPFALFASAGVLFWAFGAGAGAPPAVPAPVGEPLVILYEHDGFGGRAVELRADELDLRRLDFNDQASSLKVRRGYRATFFEHSGGGGEWFTFNCPTEPIGEKQGDYCELSSIGHSISTRWFCQLRPGTPGCVPWWNDQISAVGQIRPADERQPQGRIDQGRVEN